MFDSRARRSAVALAWRLRWGIVALFAAVLVRVALPGVVAAFGDGDPVVVLSRDLAAGETLAATDIRIARLPASAVPKSALRSQEEAVGLRLLTSMPAGSVLHGGAVGEGFASQDLPLGRVAAAVRLSDPGMAALLTPGDLVDLMASPGATGGGAVAPAQVLATEARVLPRPPPADGEDDPGLLLVAVTAREAEMLSGAAPWAAVSAILVG